MQEQHNRLVKEQPTIHEISSYSQSSSMTEETKDKQDNADKEDKEKTKDIKVPKEIKVPVRNFFLIKRLEDDPDNNAGVRLVGTFVQRVLIKNKDLNELKSLNNNDTDKVSKYFDYRFNDFTCNDGNNLSVRRTQQEPVDDGIIWRTTLQARIPLKIDVQNEIFPFKLMTATAEIELSSFTNDDNGTVVRPNIILHRKDKRLNVAIPQVEKRTNKFGECIKIVHKDINYKDVDEALDHIGKLDLLSPYPDVCFEYDGEKDYCPKYTLTFHLSVDGRGKVVGIVLPLLLVSTLNTLYLKNDMTKDDNDDLNFKNDVQELLEFSATLGLTVVFLFGNIYDPIDSKAGLLDVLYIILIFVSLILSSISENFLGGSFSCRIAGAALFWISFLFPISNYAKIRWLMRSKRPGKGSENSEEIFVNGKKSQDVKGFSEDDFITLERGPDKKLLKDDIKNELEDAGYEVEVNEKKTLIRYGQKKRKTLPKKREIVFQY